MGASNWRATRSWQNLYARSNRRYLGWNIESRHCNCASWRSDLGLARAAAVRCNAVERMGACRAACELPWYGSAVLVGDDLWPRAEDVVWIVSVAGFLHSGTHHRAWRVDDHV